LQHLREKKEQDKYLLDIEFDVEFSDQIRDQKKRTH